jgi:hypothetical protein
VGEGFDEASVRIVNCPHLCPIVEKVQICTNLQSYQKLLFVPIQGNQNHVLLLLFLDCLSPSKLYHHYHRVVERTFCTKLSVMGVLLLYSKVKCLFNVVGIPLCIVSSLSAIVLRRGSLHSCIFPNSYPSSTPC